MEMKTQPYMDRLTCNRSEASPPIPPPLPLPPPKTSSTPVSLQISSFNSVPNSRLINNAFRNSYKSIVSYCKSIDPIKQSGPQCGIVALAMASQLLCQKHCTVEDILVEAKHLNYTKSGEMFSACNLASLAESLIGCKATVITDLILHKREILNCICSDGAVLLPYDASKNHEPCLNKGKNAHWAVLNGVCLAVSKDLSGFEYESWDDDASVFTLPLGKQAVGFLDGSIQTCVYAYHGKSRNLALWDFEALLASNMNMYEVTKKYDLEHLLLPSGDDVLSDLRDKAVLLERKILV